MADEASERLFKSLAHSFLEKPAYSITFSICLIALLMSFFLMRATHLNFLWSIRSTIISKKNITFTKPNHFMPRSINQLVDTQNNVHPALLSLCHLTDIKLDLYPPLEKLVQKTQKHWLRKPGTERHELTQGCYEENQKEFLSLLKPLKVLNTVRAKHIHKLYDTVLVHGAMADTILIRIHFLIEEYQRGVRFKKVVLLSGDRPLDSKKEAEYIQLGLQTEAEMFQHVWEKTSGLPKSIKKNAYLVNTPGKIIQKRYHRPTTRDTIHQWFNEAPPKLDSQCLAISNQPFVPFQDFVLYNTSKERFGNLYLETIGACADPQEPISLHLDNLARCLYELQLYKTL